MKTAPRNGFWSLQTSQSDSCVRPRAARAVVFPHVAHVLDVRAKMQGLPFFAMELLDGNDLESELRLRGALPCEEAVHYMRQACAALAEAHRAGILHHC